MVHTRQQDVNAVDEDGLRYLLTLIPSPQPHLCCYTLALYIGHVIVDMRSYVRSY